MAQHRGRFKWRKYSEHNGNLRGFWKSKDRPDVTRHCKTDTDDTMILRDRIAASIQARWLDLTLTDTWDENCLSLADAIISDLGLSPTGKSTP